MPKRLRSLVQCALILTLAGSLAVAQNPNNGTAGGPGGGRGGPGGGGGWGGGGWGGPGGGGSPTSVATLIQNTAVQEELKLTDKQQAQVKQLKEDADKKRVQVQEQAQKVATAARQQALVEAAAAAEANGGTPFDPNANTNQNGGGRGGRGGRNDAGAIASREVMDKFQNQVEAAYLKALDPKQKKRIKQIALQAEGAGAFTNPEVIEKLGMTQEQVEAIDAIRNDSRQNQRTIMTTLFTNNDTGDAANGGNNGGGGRRPGPPDPATMQTPEFQAKLKTAQDSQTKLEDQTMATVGKALTKAQKTTFNKLIGEKFDTAQLRQGMMARFRVPGTPGQPATPAPATTPSPTAPTTTSTAAASADAATPKTPTRKSLREARGGGQP